MFFCASVGSHDFTVRVAVRASHILADSYHTCNTPRHRRCCPLLLKRAPAVRKALALIGVEEEGKERKGCMPGQIFSLLMIPMAPTANLPSPAHLLSVYSSCCERVVAT